MNKPLVVAVVAGSVLVAGAIVTRARAGRPDTPPPPPARADSTPPAPPPAAEADDAGILRARVADLEAEVARLRRRNEELERAAPRTQPPRPPEPDRRVGIAEFQAAAMDAARPAQERLVALRQLRRGGADDGRTPAVVQSMLALLETSPEPLVRADICRQIKGALPLALKDPVLRALAHDPDEKVREEAAETLGPLRGDPAVAAALQYAAENDPSPDVRAQALGRRR